MFSVMSASHCAQDWERDSLVTTPHDAFGQSQVTWVLQYVFKLVLLGSPLDMFKLLQYVYICPQASRRLAFDWMLSGFLFSGLQAQENLSLTATKFDTQFEIPTALISSSFTWVVGG